MATAEIISRPTIRQTQCFIGGEWIPAQSGKTFDTLHPATGEVIASVAEGGWTCGMKGCRIPRNGRLRKIETGASRVRGLPASDVCGNRTMGQTIAHLAERRAATISYGDKRLLEIAMVLATQPRLVLLDEPTAGLDLTVPLVLFFDVERLAYLSIYIGVHWLVPVVVEISNQLLTDVGIVQGQ